PSPRCYREPGHGGCNPERPSHRGRSQQPQPNRRRINDYVTRTWTCTVGSTPCSALGDGYSGTYYSNDGGKTWCCVATDPQHIGTLIPGVEHLVGGQYDAGGDSNLAFDNSGNIYFTGLGFDRLTAPNTVAVNKGTFD